MLKAIDGISWTIVIALCIMLGGAPFVPEPHLWEKLKMLVQGDLRNSVDIFDFLMHGAPFVLAGVKGLRALQTR